MTCSFCFQFQKIDGNFFEKICDHSMWNPHINFLLNCWIHHCLTIIIKIINIINVKSSQTCMSQDFSHSPKSSCSPSHLSLWLRPWSRWCCCWCQWCSPGNSLSRIDSFDLGSPTNSSWFHLSSPWYFPVCRSNLSLAQEHPCQFCSPQRQYDNCSPQYLSQPPENR